MGDDRHQRDFTVYPPINIRNKIETIEGKVEDTEYFLNKDEEEKGHIVIHDDKGSQYAVVTESPSQYPRETDTKDETQLFKTKRREEKGHLVIHDGKGSQYAVVTESPFQNPRETDSKDETQMLNQRSINDYEDLNPTILNSKGKQEVAERLLKELQFRQETKLKSAGLDEKIPGSKEVIDPRQRDTPSLMIENTNNDKKSVHEMYGNPDGDNYALRRVTVNKEEKANIAGEEVTGRIDRSNQFFSPSPEQDGGSDMTNRDELDEKKKNLRDENYDEKYNVQQKVSEEANIASDEARITVNSDINEEKNNMISEKKDKSNLATDKTNNEESKLITDMTNNKESKLTTDKTNNKKSRLTTEETNNEKSDLTTDKTNNKKNDLITDKTYNEKSDLTTDKTNIENSDLTTGNKNNRIADKTNNEK